MQTTEENARAGPVVSTCATQIDHMTTAVSNGGRDVYLMPAALPYECLAPLLSFVLQSYCGACARENVVRGSPAPPKGPRHDKSRAGGEDTQGPQEHTMSCTLLHPCVSSTKPISHPCPNLQCDMSAPEQERG